MAEVTATKEEWDQVINMLDQANKMCESAKPKWISVKERLPENGQVVLAFGTRSATTGQFRGVTTKPNSGYRLNSAKTP